MKPEDATELIIIFCLMMAAACIINLIILEGAHAVLTN